MTYLNVAIVFAAIYGIFELIIRQKERLLLIQKMGDNLNPEPLKRGNTTLRIACLLMGVGFGLLVAFLMLNIFFNPQTFTYRFISDNEVASVLYGSSVLLFGGFGLVVAYLIEKKNR